MSRLRHKFHRKSVEELKYFDELIDRLGPWGRSHTLGTVKDKNFEFPLKVLHLGSEDKEAPAILFTGSIHGLEKIGSDVILSYLETLSELLKWDQDFQSRLMRTRLLFFPIVNPMGVFYRTRSNANGVDLMRNAPVNAEGQKRALYSGHRISSKIPWYRGEKNKMEVESKALVDFVKDYLFSAKIAIAVDLHSGFGRRDRLWFPYASSQKPFPFLPELHKVKELYDLAYSNHVYDIEPVSHQYTIHGDLWDYLTDEYCLSRNSEDKKVFIPITLEMGSWTWVKKNPLQVLKKHGLFHPVQAHRFSRIMRRHKSFFDFLHRLLLSPANWASLNEEERQEQYLKAIKIWYPHLLNIEKAG